LDEFKSDRPDDYLAGFPDHPHRGFETVTYMLAGAMRHQDHAGNQGELVAGSVQWMTAGRGIIHSEMPRQKDGLMWGFQLWVNLPARDKMTAPRYQDIAPEKIPEATLADGVTVRVIAGEASGVRGPVEGIATRPLYLDVRMRARTRASMTLQPGHSAFVYVYDGRAALGTDGGGQEVAAGQLAVLSDGDRLSAATGDAPARFLMLAAMPLHEPIARYGPFVMNTREEIVQAVQDYQRGTLLG
ncbi:MAG TPA: pirin family protein, partial [Methylomirabilota bacterium]|nr:pirin family protein [Methylomirabilota bacterium]